MSDFPVVIYHNPRCSTSRNALSLLRDNGYAPEVVDYLKTGWSEAVLTDLAARSGGLKGLLRRKEPLAAELKLSEADEATLLRAMMAHPVLVERPIIATPKGAVVARPMSRINTVLDKRIAE